MALRNVASAACRVADREEQGNFTAGEPTFNHILQHNIHQVIVTELCAPGSVAVFHSLQGNDDVGNIAQTVRMLGYLQM